MSIAATKLYTKTIPSCGDAALLLGANEFDRQGNKLTPMILVPNRGPCFGFLALPEGFHALMTKHGKFVGIWEPGYHYIMPWERVSHLVTQQYVVFDSPVKECPTADNVMVEIDVSILFHVKDDHQDVENFVYKLGPEKLNGLLDSYQQEAVREMARLKKYSDIYDLMDTDEYEKPMPIDQGKPISEMEAEPLEGGDNPANTTTAVTHSLGAKLDNAKATMNARLAAFGIVIKDVTITNVKLPAQFRSQMEEATTFDSRNKKQAAEQRYNLLVIENSERRKQAQQRLKEEKAESISKNAQPMAEEIKKTETFKAGTRAMVADVEEKTDAMTRAIKSESQLRVTKLIKAKDLELASLKAEADAEVAKIKSEMESYVLTTTSEASAQVQNFDSQALKVKAAAEKIAATQLKAKRDFEAKMAQLRILKNLASNIKVSIASTNTDSVVAQMVAAKDASISLGLN
jgi:regulator of protease activity HflC (stomatin/prohibitin superfamily)